MKILFITNMYPSNNFPVDGIFIKDQIEALKHRFNIDYKVLVINAVRFGKIEYIKSIFKIWKEIRSNKYDLIHVHYGLSALFILFYKPKVPVILTLHGTDINERKDNRFQVSLTKFILPKVSAVIVQNETMKNIVVDYNSKVKILPCGIDFEFFNILKKVPKIPKTVVFPSSISRKVKNFPLFLKVFNIIKEKFQGEVNFVSLENFSKDKVRLIFNEADCLLLTSYTEGSPQVVKEALACGLPVVSVDVGDVEEVLKNIPYCFCSKDRNPEVLADFVISSFNNNPFEIRNLFISTHYKFDNDYLIKQLFDFYLSLYRLSNNSNVVL